MSEDSQSNHLWFAILWQLIPFNYYLVATDNVKSNHNIIYQLTGTGCTLYYHHILEECFSHETDIMNVQGVTLGIHFQENIG